MHNTPIERRAVSVVEAAQAVGISRAMVYRLIEQNKLATIKVGGRRLVPLTAIDNLLARGAESSAVAP